MRRSLRLGPDREKDCRFQIPDFRSGETAIFRVIVSGICYRESAIWNPHASAGPIIVRGTVRGRNRRPRFEAWENVRAPDRPRDY